MDNRTKQFLIGITCLVSFCTLLISSLYASYLLYKSSRYHYQQTDRKIKAKSKPNQDYLPFEMKAIKIYKSDYDYWMIPKYTYDISGKVLITDSYWFETMADISPYDISIGWGYMAHPKIKDYLTYSHGHRFFRWEFTSSAPPGVKQKGKPYIVTHSSNNHIIPANNDIRYGLSTAEAGDKIRLKGYLVNVHKFDKTGNKTAGWKTSVHRQDHGSSGCEIIYVHEAQVNQYLYSSNFSPQKYKK